MLWCRTSKVTIPIITCRNISYIFKQHTRLPSKSLASLWAMAGKSVCVTKFWLTERECKWCMLLQGHVCKWSSGSWILVRKYGFAEPIPCRGTSNQAGLGTTTWGELRSQEDAVEKFTPTALSTHLCAVNVRDTWNLDLAWSILL